MSDAYRDGLRCPQCGGTARREGWLACEDCDAVVVEQEELAASIRELDSASALDVRDARPTEARCPRCTEPLNECTLCVGPQVIGGGFLRCTRDGLWIPRDALAAIYAAAGQRGRAASAAHGRPYGPVIEFTGKGHTRSGPPPGAGMVAVEQPTGNPFSHGGELAISHWERRTPMVHTIYVSAFRGRRLVCPVCAGRPLVFEGDRWTCEGCAGAFVENAALTAMITEMSGAPWQLAVPSGTVGVRPCAVCAAPMIVEHLEGVAVDRCAGHGLWFDDHELQSALEHAGTPAPASTGGWLHRLFRRPPR